ncbi:hypothetical protein [Lewinella cohaerens]|uniref:hypothetical protein n=1 Tax=Lewinella cohaerens TaxID=70995 RepID=UPI00035E138D|nr:hypothetical protein [Lewinella cohaerens]
MSYSISAEITFLGQPVSLKPNPKVPSRIESETGITIDGSALPTLKNAFGLDALPAGLDMPEGASVKISDLVIDTATSEFQVALEMDPGTDFFLNKLAGNGDVFSLDKVYLFVAHNPASE